MSKQTLKSKRIYCDWCFRLVQKGTGNVSDVVMLLSYMGSEAAWVHLSQSETPVTVTCVLLETVLSCTPPAGLILVCSSLVATSSMWLIETSSLGRLTVLSLLAFRARLMGRDRKREWEKVGKPVSMHCIPFEQKVMFHVFSCIEKII